MPGAPFLGMIPGTDRVYGTPSAKNRWSMSGRLFVSSRARSQTWRTSRAAAQDGEGLFDEPGGIKLPVVLAVPDGPGPHVTVGHVNRCHLAKPPASRQPPDAARLISRFTRDARLCSPVFHDDEITNRIRVVPEEAVERPCEEVSSSSPITRSTCPRA